jgi:hypothetical protein
MEEMKVVASITLRYLYNFFATILPQNGDYLLL